MAISDNMMIMDKNGKIRQTGQPEEIFRNPADSFVFKFLGTSNFLPVYRDGNAFYVKTDTGYSVLDHSIPKELAMKDIIYMASRPMEVDIAAQGDIKGRIKNTTFLGNMYDYRVMLSDHELRIQKDAFEVQKQGVFKPGDTCAVKFNNYHYYGEA
jgi:iron(III) transport system ATP-binding protein